jgi:DNA invertase Pin-like site-specific DNA recombinase
VLEEFRLARESTFHQTVAPSEPGQRLVSHRLARASRPQFDAALNALEAGDTLVVTTLDRLGRSTQNMLSFADELRGRQAALRVLNLGGGDVDTATTMGSMVFTVMAALAQMELEIKRERITDSVTKRRAAGKDLGGTTSGIHGQPDSQRCAARWRR